MAAGSTYTRIANTSVSGASTIDFTSISGSYTDLVLVLSVTVSSPSGGTMYFQVGNGSLDTGTNYSLTTLGGNGSTASSTRSANISAGLAVGYIGGITASEITTVLLNFQNYSNTSGYKTVLSRGNTASSVVDANVSLWRSASAINTIRIYMSGTRTFTGTATLYGIAAA
jgi:hypothetical protein